MSRADGVRSGRYQFCFSCAITAHARRAHICSNEMSTVAGKTVRRVADLSLPALMFAASTCMAVRCQLVSMTLTTAVMYIEDDGHTAPIEKEIRALSAALEAVKDEQEYIVVRERLHRDSVSLITALV